jgi:glutathione S-transferase
MSAEVLKDVARIEHIWRECRAKFGKSGKFLFGRFSIADAMYAPVATRFDTYAVEVAEDTRAYMNTIMNTEAFASWREAALKESWVVHADEVD